MAVRQIVICDTCGDEGASERDLGWDGVAYDGDLCGDCVKQYNAIFEELTSAFHKIGKFSPTGQRRTLTQRQADAGKHSKGDLDALRGWLAEHGIAENRAKRGRVNVRVWHAWRSNDPDLARQVLEEVA